MGAAVSITRLDLTASELRKAASGEKDSSAARRILALALVLDGVDRRTAAETCGMDRQTLRDWVHRYNAAGLAGLRNLKSPGPGSNSRRGSKPNWPSLSRPVPTPRCTVSCVGGGSICATNCSGASVSRCTNVRSGRFWPSSATANCRSGPATHRLTKKPSRHVNTPPAKAGGFRLRLKAGLVRPLADSDGGCASSYLEIIVRFGRCLVLDIFGPYLIGNVSAAGDPISSAP
jgi:hypothetical protein